MIGMMRTQVRRVLDVVRATAVTSLRLCDDFRKGRGNRPCDAPHYLFSLKGSLYSAYSDAAKQMPDMQDILWSEYVQTVSEAARVFNTKRLSDSVEQLGLAAPFSSEVEAILASIVDELAEVEFAPLGLLKRRKGKSMFAGRSVGKSEWRIYVDRASTCVMVGEEEYAVTAYLDWVAMDRVLTVVSRVDKTSAIKITTAEWNALHGGCKKFFNKYVLRDVLPVESRRSNRQQWADNARFRYEKLKSSP